MITRQGIFFIVLLFSTMQSLPLYAQQDGNWKASKSKLADSIDYANDKIGIAIISSELLGKYEYKGKNNSNHLGYFQHPNGDSLIEVVSNVFFETVLEMTDGNVKNLAVFNLKMQPSIVNEKKGIVKKRLIPNFVGLTELLEEWSISGLEKVIVLTGLTQFNGSYESTFIKVFDDNGVGYQFTIEPTVFLLDLVQKTEHRHKKLTKASVRIPPVSPRFSDKELNSVLSEYEKISGTKKWKRKVQDKLFWLCLEKNIPVESDEFSEVYSDITPLATRGVASMFIAKQISKNKNNKTPTEASKTDRPKGDYFDDDKFHLCFGNDFIESYNL